MSVCCKIYIIERQRRNNAPATPGGAVIRGRQIVIKAVSKKHPGSGTGSRTGLAIPEPVRTSYDMITSRSQIADANCRMKVVT